MLHRCYLFRQRASMGTCYSILSARHIGDGKVFVLELLPSCIVNLFCLFVCLCVCVPFSVSVAVSVGRSVCLCLCLCRSHSCSQWHDSPERVPEEQLWAYLGDLAAALAHLKCHNIVHLDVKASNIFLTDDDRCVLGDFGIATAAGVTGNYDGDATIQAPEVFGDRFVILRG